MSLLDENFNFSSSLSEINIVLVDDNFICVGCTIRITFNRITRWPQRTYDLNETNFILATDILGLWYHIMYLCISEFIQIHITLKRRLQIESWAIWIPYGLYQSNWLVLALNVLYLICLNHIFNDGRFFCVFFFPHKRTFLKISFYRQMSLKSLSRGQEQKPDPPLGNILA